MPDGRTSATAEEGPEAAAPRDLFAPWRRRWRSRKVVVRDHSMEPTFLPGDRLLVDPAAYRTGEVARDDLVVVADPTEPDRWLLKRVVGIPGDFVRVTREGIHRVARAGEGPVSDGALEELEVPPGHVFVLSDRPQHARDSRQFGPVPVGALLGRVWRVHAPAGRARSL
ncbi:MAG: signal peptidase I [Thermoplasmata archaeon]|nr:signal peptidase I [Thermoplasmata archaeon]